MSSRSRSLLAVLALVAGVAVHPLAASAEVAPGVPRPGVVPPPPSPAEQALGALTLAQQVGQLFVVGTPVDRADRRTAAQIARLHVGNVMLTGRSHHGVRAPSRVTRTMRASVSTAATGGIGLLVATDQEGGLVRVLRGAGFSSMP